MENVDELNVYATTWKLGNGFGFTFIELKATVLLKVFLLHLLYFTDLRVYCGIGFDIIIDFN